MRPIVETPGSNKAGNGGFTLVEVMVALSLLAIILASLLGVFDSIMGVSRTSSNLTAATLDAQGVMQEAINYPFDNLLSYTPSKRKSLMEEDISVYITDEDGAPATEPLPDMVRIEVLVTWVDLRGTPARTALKTRRTRGF